MVCLCKESLIKMVLIINQWKKIVHDPFFIHLIFGFCIDYRVFFKLEISFLKFA